MDIPEELRQEIMMTFQAELEEHSGALNKGLLALEKGPSPEEQRQLLADLFRTAHNLKGAARAVGLRDIVNIADRLEDLLGALQEGKLSPSPELLDIIFPAVDAIQEAMAAHVKDKKLPVKQRENLLNTLKAALKGNLSPRKGDDAGSVKTKGPKTRKAPKPAAPLEEKATETQPAPPPEPEQPKPKRQHPKPDIPQSAIPAQRNAKSTRSISPGRNPQSEESIRVATAKLDALMDGMGELLVARMSNEQRLTELRTIQERISRWRKSWRQVRVHYNYLLRQKNHEPNLAALLDFFSSNEDTIKTIGEGMDLASSKFATDYARLALLTDDLQDGVRRVRMLPISTLFDRFPRMVRDLARERGKAITLLVEGADAELDRHVLEDIKDPLIHLLRNGVGHGIESSDAREAAGKSREGTIYLRAAQKGNTIVVEVADDGAGIDLQEVRRAAVERGFLTEQEVSGLSQDETRELVFRSGLSTETRANDLSGRGVGLDVVRQNLEQMNGRILVDSTPGQGTTFTLILPLTLATNQVLLVKIGGEIMAIPTTSVERIERVKKSDVRSIEGKPAIRTNGRALPLISLHQVLGMERRNRPRESDRVMQVVILGLAERCIAFEVEGLQGTQEVVIKNMGRQLSQVPNVAGATILGSGEVVMILNVADLLKSTQTGPPIAPRQKVEEKKMARRRVLVVDDSITTRTLEKNILENAGYHVLVSSDGEEAWALVQSEPLDAIVADVHMPRMDGIGLTKYVKNDEQYKTLPLVLVTSLDSRQDKIRGLEAGADAYITKQTFDQKELLETIERLIG